MSEFFSEAELKAALEACASEPVRIPGRVQPHGCVLGIRAEDEEILYASANCEAIIGHAGEALLGRGFGDVFGRKLMHDVRNALGRAAGRDGSETLGLCEIGAHTVVGHTFQSGPVFVVEFEPDMDAGLGSTDALQVVRFLMEQIQGCADQESLFKLSVRLMRHLTGYDRVMAYRFDHEYNGEVIAEALARGMEPFFGLRYPHWDIPAQAREIMAILPLRYIQDARQEPEPLLAVSEDLPPLDMTFAACRGVSPVHLQYLENMGSRATMSLSIVIEGRLWGLISFHHREPKVPAPLLREVLTSFAEIFRMKLQALLQQDRLGLVTAVDELKDTVLREIEENTPIEDALERVGPMVQKVMQASGSVMISDTGALKTGQVPGKRVLEQLKAAVNETPGGLLAIDNLAARFPEMGAEFDGCAGALVVSLGNQRTFCIFREEEAQTVSWAGNPEKTVEAVGGQLRLQPRGSFSTYLQEVQDTCAAWSDQDIYFAKSIWTLVNAAERQALMRTLTRQQKLMIDELNHRVRNILALVRSVSQQARRRYGSFESYARSLESRIMALAAAHDIASGSAVSFIDVKPLIVQELSPYMRDQAPQVSGESAHLRADVAPIFALVIHELATNAAKYGALSGPTGQVSVTLKKVADGLEVTWVEKGGPPVVEPKDRGFGTVLIENAINFELDGEAALEFRPEGVQARIVLPQKALMQEDALEPAFAEPRAAFDTTPIETFDGSALEGVVLLVEDNFVIAQEMHDKLEDFGFTSVETCSNVKDALALLDEEVPLLAVLDVNLGSDETSIPIAERLLALHVPFTFVTGYGDTLELPELLDGAMRLTKPVPDSDLNKAFHALLSNAL